MTRFEIPLQSRSSEARAPSSARMRSRSRQAAGLASARDRQRVRDREAAERERVERMLSAVPAVEERRARERDPARGQGFLRAVEPPSCPVCRSTKLTSDEVMHAGTLRLSECLHCEHRWTERPRRRWAELGATMTRGARSAVVQAVIPSASPPSLA